MPVSKRDVAVLGGGIAGLAAAFELQQAGVDFVLLEASSWLGGQIRTARSDGFIVELGAEGLTLQDESIKELIAHMDLTDRMVSQEIVPSFVLTGTRKRQLEQGEAAEILGFRFDPTDGAVGLVTFKTGMSELAEAFANRLPTERTLLEAPVTSITRGRGLYRIEFGSGRAQLARALVIAVPALEVARLFGVLDRPTAERFAQISPVSSVSVSLAYPGTAVRGPVDESGVIVQPMDDKDVGLRAMTYVSQKFPAHAPPGWFLFRAFYRPGGSLGIEGSDDVWVRAATRDVARVLGVSHHPHHTWVARWPSALHRYDEPALHELELARERLSNREPIEIAGAASDGDGVERAILSARRAVGRLLTGLPSVMARKATT